MIELPAAPHARRTFGSLGLVALAASLCGLEGLASANDRDPNVLVKVSIYRYSGFLRIPMRFENGTYLFLLDTGCDKTSIDESLCPSIGTPTGRSRVETLHGQLSVATCKLPRATIGNLIIPPLDGVHCVDLSREREVGLEIYGYLGMDALRSFLIRIDFDQGWLSFLRALPDGEGPGIPLDRQQVRPLVRGAIGGVATSFEFDTGCWIYGAGTLTENDFKLRDGRTITSSFIL